MKKDFSQPFKIKKTRAYLLAQDGASKKYAILHFPGKEGFYGLGEDTFTTLDFTLKSNENAPLQIVAYLHRAGLATNSIRELTKETHLSYSLLGNSEGTATDHVSFYIVIDKTNAITDKIGEGTLRWITLSRIAALLKTSSTERTIIAAIAQLKSEAITLTTSKD